MTQNIPYTKYVNILSAFAGGQAVNEKQPYARIMTQNSLLPYGNPQEFSSLEDVQAFFGGSSTEAILAQMYFAFISKRIRKARKISFGRWTSGTAQVNATVISGTNIFALSKFKEISEGTMTFSYTDVAGESHDVNLTGINLSGVSDLAGVANAITEKFTDNNIKVEYDTSGTNGSRFVMHETSTQATAIESFSSVETDLGKLLGFDKASGVLLSEVIPANTTVVEQLEYMDNINDNYFTLIFSVPTDLTLLNAESVAQWNANKNCDHHFVVSVNKSNYTEWQTTLSGFTGTSVVYDASNDNKFMIPAMCTAAIDYSKEDAAINFMYQAKDNNYFTADNVMGLVGGKRLYKILDEANINYYASTQTAGSKLSFFQNGVMQGSVSSMTVYVNSIWLKAKIVQKAMETFMLNDAIYANKDGEAKFAAKMINVWELAKLNKTIIVNKALSDSEKASIEAITGDELAWQKVYSQGYVFEYSIETNPDNGAKYFNYRLIYAACDTVNTIEGTNIAITSTAK